MSYLSVKDLKTPKYLRERLREDRYLMVTNHGRPMALMMDIGEGEDPEALLEAVREARARIGLSRIRASAKRSGVDKLSLKSINAEIEAARKERRTTR